MSAPSLVERQKPGLSATLPHPRHPETCQACGGRGAGWDRWIECDEWDRPTDVIVVLCPRCSNQVIQPSPRLYVQAWPGIARPGVMGLCASCDYHEALRCLHPDLRANGGQGLMVHQPSVIGIACHGRGVATTLYDGIPRRCVGRTVAGRPAPGLGVVE